jgi:nucleotide-binding universal stress UspA family protein
MENKLIVLLDGTESAVETLLYTTSIVPRGDTELTLLHVMPLGRKEPEAEVEAHIRDIHDALGQGGWSVTRETRMGDAVEEIVKFTILNSATMLLMSTHGRTGIERIREGSVTEHVVRQSPCPVFILHSVRAEPADRRKQYLFRRVLVPLDGTDASAAILGCVEVFAKVHDSEVVIFHDEMESAGPQSQQAAIKATLQEHSVRLANAGLKVSLDMSTYKRPIREILNKIDELEIDLVAMASHGKTGTPRALEESVTAEVIRHANCPLLVWSADPQCPPVSKV